MVKYIGHTTTTDHRSQILKDHLSNTRDLCFEYGRGIKMSYICGLAGWLHDAGKYSEAFQQYIRIDDGLDENKTNTKVNHAFAGARILYQVMGEHELINTGNNDIEPRIMAALVGNAIMAHHNSKGPYDFFNPRHQSGVGEAAFKDAFPFFDKLTQDISDWKLTDIMQRFFSDGENDQQVFVEFCNKAIAEARALGQSELFRHQFYYQRFISSALVDADHLDTANFAEDVFKVVRDTHAELNHLNDVNEQSVAKLAAQVAPNPATESLNKLRQQMSDRSAAMGNGAAGLYSLSVPTGGGKTFASLRFALHQAKQHGFERIIYVVPYTTIIEQNAKQMRQALQVDEQEELDQPVVLEYHSAVSEEGKPFNYYYARDTWEAPIIVTSQVGLLNAVFGKGSKNIRHMHCLTNSVIIYDEVQTIPVKMISMNNALINWLVHSGNSSVLLCTATQPALGSGTLSHGLSQTPKEIVKNLADVEQAFKRVEIISHLEESFSIPKLSEFVDSILEKDSSVLVILNTKAAVKEAYLNFEHEDTLKFFLSTDMCVAHRKMRFAKIREVLKDNPADNKKVVVFSTRLIEAGVDLSFQTVIRSLAGLDSVVQAAGRCNRNHERPMGKVHLIALDNGIEKLGSLMELKQGVTSAKGVLENSTDLDLLSSDVIKTFFQSYYGALNERKEVDYKVEIRKGEFQTLFQWGNLQKDTEGSLINQEHYQNTLQQFFANEPDDKEKAKIDTFLNATAALSASPQAIASELKVIDQATTPVIVGFNPEADTDDFLSATNSLKGDVLANEIGEKINGKDIITALLSGKCDFSEISRLLKQAQAYTVQVYNLDKYRGLGKIKPMPELDIYYFYDYDKELGMDPENFDSDDSFM